VTETKLTIRERVLRGAIAAAGGALAAPLGLLIFVPKVLDRNVVLMGALVGAVLGGVAGVMLENVEWRRIFGRE